MPTKQHSDPFSERVRLYSFILTILVIWIHAVRPRLAELVTPAGAAAYDAAAAGSRADALMGQLSIRAEQVLGMNLGQIAVPGFFILSGALFFAHFPKNPAGSTGNVPSGLKADINAVLPVFIRKGRSRIRTLLIPYLIWNLLYYLVYLAAGRAEFTAENLIAALLYYRWNPVFWYLQQLILLTMMTPVLWLLLKARYRTLPALVLLFLLSGFYQHLPWHIVNEDALFYYAAGAAAGLHLLPSGSAGRTLDSVSGRRADAKVPGEAAGIPGRQKRTLYASFVCCFFYIILQPAAAQCFAAGAVEPGLLCTVGLRFAGALALWLFLAGFGLPSRKCPSYMGETFFIYASHYLELRLIQHGVRAVIASPGAELLMYLLMPALCVLLSLLGARILRTCLPPVYRILTGGRNM